MKVKAKQDITYLLPADQYDKAGATHKRIPKDSIGTIAHNYENGEVVVDFPTDTVICHKDDLEYQR